VFERERVAISVGERSGLPVIVAAHSTVLGQAVGGCRLWSYRNWRDALDDAPALSEAMTLKCALAGLPLGGGKSVIALAPDDPELTPQRRRKAMLDLGDAVDAFGGCYGVGEDVGTTAEDMLIARERTRYASCLPESQGGAGEPSEPTAEGVRLAIGVTLERTFGTPNVAGRAIGIVGLGQVGADLLHERGILWAPDFVVNAGGVIYASASSRVPARVSDSTMTQVISPPRQTLGLRFRRGVQQTHGDRVKP
jgi:leucine dehydrogenase